MSTVSSCWYRCSPAKTRRRKVVTAKSPARRQRHRSPARQLPTDSRTARPAARFERAATAGPHATRHVRFKVSPAKLPPPPSPYLATTSPPRKSKTPSARLRQGTGAGADSTSSPAQPTPNRRRASTSGVHEHGKGQRLRARPSSARSLPSLQHADGGSSKRARVLQPWSHEQSSGPSPTSNHAERLTTNLLELGGAGTHNSVRNREVVKATRRLEESTPYHAEHDKVVAKVLALGHDASANKAERLSGTLGVSRSRVKTQTKEVRISVESVVRWLLTKFWGAQLKELLAATRGMIPPELLFSEGLKKYREEWAAGTAVKVMGRILHGLTSSAWQKWQTYTKFRRWEEADKAVRSVQRVVRGFMGRRHFKRVLAAKRAREAKARKRAARVSAVAVGWGGGYVPSDWGCRQIKRKKDRAATKIQKIVRGVFGRATAKHRAQMIKSAIMIQRKYRAHHSKLLVFLLEQRRLHRNLMATHIQRVRAMVAQQVGPRAGHLVGRSSRSFAEVLVGTEPAFSGRSRTRKRTHAARPNVRPATRTGIAELVLQCYSRPGGSARARSVPYGKSWPTIAGKWPFASRGCGGRTLSGRSLRVASASG